MDGAERDLESLPPRARRRGLEPPPWLRQVLPKPAEGGMPDYGWAYYDYLVAQFRALPLPTEPLKQELWRRVRDQLFSIHERNPPLLNWNDLSTLESRILELEPDLGIPRKAWLLRGRYRSMAGAEEYAQYELTNPPKLGDEAEIPKLRADLRTLLAELHFLYNLTTTRENLREHLSYWVGFWTVLAVGLGFIGVLWDYLAAPPTPPAVIAPQAAPGANPTPLTTPAVSPTVSGLPSRAPAGPSQPSAPSRPAGTRVGSPLSPMVAGVPTVSGTAPPTSPAAGPTTPAQAPRPGYLRRAAEWLLGSSVPHAPLLFFIMMMGALGGFVSVHQRLQQAPPRGDTLRSVMELEHGRYVVMSAPLFGAIFAVILYLLFVSGYVSGDLVPKFLPSADSTGALRFREFMDRAQPLAVQDVGKVLIWSFLAGFAERLVPDALDRLVARQQAAETTAASGAIPPRPLAEAVETAGTTSATGATPVAAISAHVREVVPSQDATLPSTDPLVIRFTEPVQEADVALISETGAAIELDAHWNTEMTELRLEHAPLAPGTYTLTLTALYLPDGIELDERAQVTFHIV